MTAPYYVASGTPQTGSQGYSAAIRGEFLAVQAGFALLPQNLTPNAAVIVNSGGTGMTVTTGTLALGAAFATTGGFGTTLIERATTSLTLPAASDTLVGRATTDTLTNKTLTAPTITTMTYGGVTLSNAVTGTGNMVLSASPTITGTLNAAIVTLSSNLNLANGSDINWGSGIQTISLNGSSQVQVTNNTNGVYLDINATAWSAVSLRSKKCNFEPITNPRSRIMGMRAELGRYITDNDKQNLRPFNYVEDALIHFPWAVDSDGEGLRSTDFIPLLFAGLHDLYRENEKLRARLAALERKAT